MVTRRTSQRQYLLRPDDECVNAFIYCLAVASQRFGVAILTFVQMSNHLHDVLYDRYGNAPEFYACFHGLLARCVNSLRGRWENVFSSSQPNVVNIGTTVDLIERLVYVAINPIKHGLVARVDHWPGASGYLALLENKPIRATRPKHFFREDGDMPLEVTLHVGIPPELGDRDEILAEVKARVEAYEREKDAERAATGQKVLGRYAVLRQAWSAAPATRAPRRQPHRKIAATFRETLFKLLDRARIFELLYREARAALLDGTPIPFPFGTYWLRRFAGVEVSCPQFLS